MWEDERRRATDVLLITNAAVFAVQLLSRGVVLSWGSKVRRLWRAQEGKATPHSTRPRFQVNSHIAAGQLWRLVTPALLHRDVLHLLVNTYSLNELGPSVEALLGRGRFAALYAASAVGGNVTSFMMNPLPTVGASSVVFGLAGCMGVCLARHRHLHGELELRCVPPLVALRRR